MKMHLREITVFASLLLSKSVLAQEDQQELEFEDASDFVACTMCQDGSPITTPDAIIPDLELTCAEVADEASFYPVDSGCRYYHRYGNDCGCDNTPPEETFCELCQDGTEISDPSVELEGYQKNCGGLQTDAGWNLIFAYQPVEESNCNFYYHAGSLCGCANNVPLDNGCKLCPDGNRPPNPEQPVSPGNVAEGTCGAYATLVEYSREAGTPECEKVQSTVGAFCGCTNPPDKLCPMCPEGQTVKDGPAPNSDVELGPASTAYPLIDETCIGAELFLAELSTAATCVEANETVTAECCVPVTNDGGSGSDVASGDMDEGDTDTPGTDSGPTDEDETEDMEEEDTSSSYGLTSRVARGFAIGLAFIMILEMKL